jgi:DNA-directed RNA polymerase subunit H (RpoH/RPB5)
MLTPGERVQVCRTRATEMALLTARGVEVDDQKFYCCRDFSELLKVHGYPEDATQLAEALSGTYDNIDGSRLVVRYILTDVNEECIPYLMGLSDTIKPPGAIANGIAFRAQRLALVSGAVQRLTTIIISMYGISSVLQNMCVQRPVSAIPWTVQIFAVAELQLDPLNNVLTPPHEVLTPDAVRDLGLVPAQLPVEPFTRKMQSRISPGSPGSAVAKFYGMHDGDVVRITRQNISSMAGKTRIYYRVCREVE